MKKEELKFTADERQNDFIIKCIFNGWFEDYCEIAETILASSNTTDDFIKQYLTDGRLKMTQGYAEISRTTSDHWYRVREILGDQCYKAYSDAGSLKIGDENWSINISNGIGDGVTRFGVVTEKINGNMLDFVTTVKGTFNVYKYDCGNEVVTTLSGEYGIYCYEGIIIFEKWN